VAQQALPESVVGASLRYAAPALLAFAAVRLLGLAVLAGWSSVAGRDAHRLLVSWDGQWYATIAENGYGFVRVHEDGRVLSDYAFFPLFPWLERLVAGATGLPVVDAGLLVSGVASVVAAWGIFAIGARLGDRRIGVLLAVVWAALPVGIVASMAYSESLFTALAAWSLYGVMTRHWIWAGTLAALAGLTRPVGVAVVAAVVIPAAIVWFRHVRRGPENGSETAAARAGGWRVAVGALVAPLGWLGYVGWVGLETGNLLGYFEVTGRWATASTAGSPSPSGPGHFFPARRSCSASWSVPAWHCSGGCTCCASASDCR
jgi:hypothetical protein